MKYLFINASLTDGGSEHVMTLLANEFAESGHDTSMILIREKKTKNYSLCSRVKCKQLHYGTHNKVLIMFKRFIKLRRSIKEIKPDVIISFMYDINFFVLLTCLGLKRRVIISERAHPKLGTSGLLGAIYKNWGQMFIYPLASKIVLQTSHVKQYYTKNVQDKCVVIPNPVGGDLPKPWKGNRNKQIVAAGRLTKQKNFALLIRAFKRFHNNHEEYRLSIYGEGEFRDTLEELTRVLHIGQFVDFPGYIHDVKQKMQKAAMYVSSSDFEGISNSMLEALAMGVPTICTDCPVGGASMMIRNRENGILIPVGDEDALVNAMSEIADNEEFARAISEKAIEVRRTHSVSKIAMQWLSLCEQL